MNKKQYYIYQIDVNILNIGCTILTLLVAIFTYIIYPTYIIDILNIYSPILLVLVYILYMMLHEIIHSIAYVLYGGNYQKIVYGICFEKGVFYCLCKQNINKNNILHSLLYPLIWIGIVTYIIAIIFKLPLLLSLSILNIGGCIGDILMFIFINKLDNDIEFSEFDDPISFGIFTDKDITKESHFGLKYIETRDKLERKDLRKITITKTSYIIIILMILLAILNTVIK